MEMHENRELVTAVITTHKREAPMLERALKSVLEQTYQPMQVIVVDDSPADFPGRPAVKEMLQERYPQVLYLQHETCRGACAARNTGLERAEGAYIAFLDDDDEWLPRKTACQVAAFTDDRIALVYSDVEEYEESTGKVTPVLRAGRTGDVFEKLIRNNFIGSCSYPMLRIDALRQIGGFDVLMQASQDHDVWLRLMQRYHAGYVREILVRYHIHAGDQITKNYHKFLAGRERIDEKHAAYLQQHPQILWYRKLRTVGPYAKTKQYKKAFRTWWSAVKLQPGKLYHNGLYFLVLVKNILIR